MKAKKSLLIFIFVILALITVAGVSAADTNDTVTAIDDQSDNLNEIQTQDDIVASNATEEILSDNANDNAVSSSDEDTLGDDDWGTFQELQNYINGGNHILDKNYRYTEGDPTEIVISSSCTIFGNNHVVDGQGVARLFHVKSDAVKFNGVHFKNGHAQDGAAIYCPNNANMEVSSCIFEGCTATNGGAIYVGGSGFQIHPNVGETRFSNCNATVAGGAIYLTSGATGATLGGKFENCYSGEDPLYTSKKGAIHNEIEYTDGGCTFSGTVLTVVKFTSSHLTTVYGVNDYLKVTLKLDNGTGLAGVNITVNLNNKTKNYTTDENGTIEIPALGLDVDEYTATFDYVDDVVYTSVSGSQKITVKQATSAVTIKDIHDFNFNEDMIVDFTVANRTTINAVITGDGRKILIENITGNNVDLGSLPVGEYSINITNIETQNIIESSDSASFKVIKNETKENTTIAAAVAIAENNVTITATVNSAATGLVEFDVAGKTLYVDVENGKAVYDVVLPKGEYTVVVTYLGDENFNTNTTSKAFTVPGHVKKNTKITSEAKVDDMTVTISAEVDKNATGHVVMDISGIDVIVPVKDGKATFTYLFNVGSYNIDVIYLGDENFNNASTTVSFNVTNPDKKNTNITLDVIIDGVDAAFTVNVDANATGLIEFNVDNRSVYVPPENGTAFYFVDLMPGDYNITVTYLGDDKFNPNSTTKAFTVDQVKTQLISSKVSVTYGNSKNVVVTLTDSRGNLLIGQSVSVKINGKTTTKTTDSKGQISVATSKSLAPKTYTATLTFAGDITYAKSTESVKVAVSKDKSKISAKAKSYKKSTKTKKYSITLKASSTSKAIKNVKVTLKVNGKTYSAKTSSKGKATFKITKLTKKGKYTATIKFKGNTYYKSVSKNVKITVKK